MSKANEATQAKPEQARLLVVDDSTVIRQAIRKMLSSDFDVTLAEHGEAGWSKLVEDEQVKLLVTDIEMPHLDGYAFICRVRASDNPRLRELPIIAITGAEDEETKARAYACGATDFITKPLDRMQLLARAHAYIKFDQTNRKLAEKSAVLEEQVTTDPLTQVASRRYLMQRGEQDLSYALRHRAPLGLARIDVDNVKKIYQQYGDEAVDQILIWLGKSLVDKARTEDTVARIGGAEFALLAPATGRDDMSALCERLRSLIGAQPFVFGAHTIPVTLSIGVVNAIEKPVDSLDTLFKIAEQRLRRAKSEGGNRVSTRALGETLQEVEEVVLTAPAPVPDAPIAVPEPELEPVFITPVPAVAERANGHSTETGVVELVSLDKAVEMLAKGHGDRLAPYLGELARRALPLLELYLKKKPKDPQSTVDEARARLMPLQ